MKIDITIGLLLLLTTLFGATFFINEKFENSFVNLVASVFFTDSITVDEIVGRYEDGLSKNTQGNGVKIMIVPGHDDENFGALFNGIKEADLNLKLAKHLSTLLQKEKGVEVLLVRDDNGYESGLSEFLKDQDKIKEFYQEKKEIMNDLVENGQVVRKTEIHHNFAKPEVVTVLYGINKYANDNDFDIVLHIHFNDYPGRKSNGGKYNGFSIYIPEKQYSNSKASKTLAEKIYNHLSYIFAKSNLKGESSGIIEDQELIAVGSHNTADPIAILIEYGYIYESQFHNQEISEIVLRELANKTFSGIKDFLKEKDSEPVGFVELDNYLWQKNIGEGDRGQDVLSLQNFLRKENFYPNSDNLNNCPLSGYYGKCTIDAISKFQSKNGLNPTGFFGDQTRELVQRLQ